MSEHEPIELESGILKLQVLQLVAAQKQGESIGLQRYVDDLRDARGALVREQLELKDHHAPNRAVLNNIRARLGRVRVRLAYVDAAITAANQRLEQVSAAAGDARTLVEKTAEHLRRELAAIGLR